MKRSFLLFLIVAMLLSAVGAAERPEKVRFVDELIEIDGRALQGLRIGIDPGHQAHADTEREAIAPGSRETKAKVAAGTRGTATGISEYAVNLQLSLLLRQMLTEMGAQVLMTRETNDVNLSNQQRAIMMNDWGADFVVRVHCNGSTDHSVSGISVYVRQTGEGARESEQLAQSLLKAMCAATGAKKKGVVKRDSYTGLNWSTVPCVLVETGFLTNPEEDRKLNDPEYQALLCKGMVEGMIEYAEKMKGAR